MIDLGNLRTRWTDLQANYGWQIISAASGVIVLSLFLAYCNVLGGIGQSQPEVYFLDLNTGKLLVRSANTPSPNDAKSGPRPDGGRSAVLAYVYACNDCSDPAEHFGYIEAYGVLKPEPIDPRLVERLRRQRKPLPQPRGRLIEAAPDDSKTQLLRAAYPFADDDGPIWFKADSVEGSRLQNEIFQRCGAAEPVVCLPN